jgi:lipopolysaccharide biosynthesis regulator YciM
MNFIVAFAAIAVVVLLVIMFKKRSINSTSDKHTIPEGFALLASGDRDSALEIFVNMAKKGSVPPEIYLTIAVIYRVNGDYNKAVQINEALAIRDNTPKDILALALKELVRLYRITRNTHRAEEFIGRIGKLHDYTEINMIESFIAIGKGSFEAALKRCQRSFKLGDAVYGKELGLIYIAMAEKATEINPKIKYLNNAIRIDPFSHKAFFTLLGLTEETRLCEEIVKNNMLRTKEDVRQLENICFKHDKLEWLKAILMTAVEKGEKHPAPYLFLANYLKKLGEQKKAADLLVEYLSMNATATVIQKVYAAYTKDALLVTITSESHIYQCGECGKKLYTYSDICPECGFVDSVDYIS